MSLFLQIVMVKHLRARGKLASVPFVKQIIKGGQCHFIFFSKHPHHWHVYNSIDEADDDDGLNIITVSCLWILFVCRERETVISSGAVRGAEMTNSIKRLFRS